MNARAETVRITRRSFLIAGAGVAGSLVIGVPVSARAQGGDNERMIGYFIEIRPDGTVVQDFAPALPAGSPLSRFRSGASNPCPSR